MARFVSPPDLWDAATLAAIGSGALVLQPGQRFRCGPDDRATHVLDRVRIDSALDIDGKPYLDFRAFHGPRAARQRYEFHRSGRLTEIARIAAKLQREAAARGYECEDTDSLIPAECATAWDVMCGAIMGVDCNGIA